MARKETQASVIARVRNRFEQSRSAQQEMQDVRDEYYKRYRSYNDPIQDEDGEDVTGRSNLFVPRTYSSVETVHTRMMNAIFSGPMVFGAKPQNEKSVDQAESMEHVMKWQADKVKFRSAASDVLKAGLMYETGIGKIVWYRARPRRVRKLVRIPHPRAPVAALGVTMLVERIVEKSPYTGPRVISVDPDDFFGDPASTTPYPDEEDRCVIHRLWEPLSLIMRKARENVYDVRAAKKLERVPSEEVNKPKNRRQELVGDSEGEDGANVNESDPVIELLEYWTHDEVIVVPRWHDFLLRQEANPYGFIPFAMWRDVTIPNERGGISEIEAMSANQDALNTTTNAVIDQAKLNIINPMAYDAETLDVDERDLDVSDGKPFVPVRGIPAGHSINEYIWQFPVGNLTAIGPELINMFKVDMQDATGTYDNVRGQAAIGETATEANIRAQAASSRFETKIRNFESEFLATIGQWWAELNQMFLDEEVVVRLEDDQNRFDFRTIKPEDIAGDFDIEVRGANVDSEVSPTQHRQDFVALLQQLVALLPALAQVAPETLKQIDWGEIMRYGMGLFEPNRVDDFFPPQPEQPPGAPGLLGPNGQPLAPSAPGMNPGPPAGPAPMTLGLPPPNAPQAAPGPPGAPSGPAPNPQAAMALAAILHAAAGAQTPPQQQGA